MMTSAPSHPPRVREIQQAVCAHYGLSSRHLLSASRRRSIVRARQVGMFLAHRLTRRSLTEIAHDFKRGDHTTALWAIRQIEQLSQHDPEISAAIGEISELLASVVENRPPLDPKLLALLASVPSKRRSR